MLLKSFPLAILALVLNFLPYQAISSTDVIAVHDAVEQQVHLFGNDLLWHKVTGLEYPMKTVNSSNGLMLLVHGTSYWDPKHVITEKFQAVREWGRQQQVPTLSLASADERVQLRLRGSEVFPFEGDTHLISLNGKPVIYFAGGNFSQCLCNAVRSSIIHHSGVNPSSQALDLYLMTDAIYEQRAPSILHRSRLQVRVDGASYLLSDLLSVMNDREVLKYLRKDWLKTSDQLPCPLYVPSLLTPLQKTYRYQVFRGSKVIGTLGSGDYLVNLHLISTAELLQPAS